MCLSNNNNSNSNNNDNDNDDDDNNNNRIHEFTYIALISRAQWQFEIFVIQIKATST